MNLFEFSPIKNAKKLQTLVSVSFLGAAALMAITVIFGNMAYRWVVQLLSIFLLMAGVFVTSRYVMKGFVYAVIGIDGNMDFTVTEVQTRHRITVCRISLSSIEKVLVVEKNDKDAEKKLRDAVKEQNRKKFNYCVDPFVEKYVCVFANEGGELSCIKLSWDAELEKILSDAANGEKSEKEED